MNLRPRSLVGPALLWMALAARVSSDVAPALSNRLVRPENLVYQGSFSVPYGSALKVSGTDRGFDYGGLAPAFNPANNSLFLVSHVYDNQTAEIGIPDVLGLASSPESLPVGAVLQPFADALEGHRLDVADRQENVTTNIGGQLVYNGQLYLDAYVYYGTSGPRPFYRRSLSLSTRGTLQGGMATTQPSDFVNGPMAVVPPEWRTELGGPVLAGNCCLSIISRTSYGPSVSSLDLATLWPSSPAQATTLVSYPSAHKTLGDWGTAGRNLFFNGTSQVKGIVFPEGTASVLFIGRHGLGPYCYDEGSVCNDPEDGSKGDHAYPYAYYVWAYDAHELAQVKAGRKRPWDVRPYAVWPLALPASSRIHRLGGVAYDPATGRIFISQQFADGDSGNFPLIHIYAVQ